MYIADLMLVILVSPNWACIIQFVFVRENSRRVVCISLSIQ